MALTITQIYQLLSEKTDQQTAEALVAFIEEKTKKEVEIQNKEVVTKEYLHTELTEIRKEIASQTRWLVGVIITVFAALGGAIIGLYFK